LTGAPDVREEGTARVPLALVGTAFLLSGAAALVYQVVWQRLLALHTGVGITSIALIVAAFMAGLGLGSEAGGVLSARVSPATALRLFAAIELAVGVLAAFSCSFYYGWLARHAGSLYESTGGMAVAHFLALLVPTGLMGMSLPFLVRATVADTAGASRTIGTLYGVNVLGASLGALLAPWVLIRFYGMEGAVLWGVAANLVAGVAALLAGRRGPRSRTIDPEAPRAGAAPEGRSLLLWTVLYALSGFCALSLEILWFRLTDVSLKSTAFTFGTVLCLYLLGLGSGSLVGGRISRRFESPLRVFLDAQCLLLLYAALAVAVLVWLPPGTPVYRWFFEYWKSGEFYQLGADWNAASLLRLYLLLPAFLFGPPTVLMGISFAALQRAVQDDPRTSGRKVGLLQAANIAGCVAGSLSAGLLFLDRFGTTGTLRVLLLVGLVFAGVRAARLGRGAGLAWAGALVLAASALPGGEALWRKLHGVVGGPRPSFIGEDSTAVSAVLPLETSHWRVTVNGLPHSWIPFEGIHTLLGAVPAVVHPSPERVAVIGLGSGETASALASRKETREITIFEIAGAQPRLLRAVAGVARLPDLERFLRDERVRIVVADGRNALLRSDARYDLIQVDALYRTSAMSGNLYSVEFFRLCASRLRPGGIVCSQTPTRRAALSFAAALPHAIDLGNIMVGGNEPLPIDVPAWRARLEAPDVLAWFGPDVAEGILARLTEARPPWGNPASRRGLNLDLFPRDEFSTPVGN
jgi:predicted membrane-bound spermidine synthase